MTSKSYLKKWKGYLIVSIFLIIAIVTCKVKTYPYSFKTSTQNRLTTLVAYLELYQKDAGHYPDSLKEILKYSIGLHEIMDNLPGDRKNRSANALFFYKKLSNGYILFSTGIDELPFTKDDIIPDIKKIDTSKIGLVIQ
jgi:hypothetical protein